MISHRCDQCQQNIHHNPDDLFTLAVDNWKVRSENHFCSWLCLTKYARLKAVPPAEKPEGSPYITGGTCYAFYNGPLGSDLYCTLNKGHVGEHRAPHPVHGCVEWPETEFKGTTSHQCLERHPDEYSLCCVLDLGHAGEHQTAPGLSRSGSALRWGNPNRGPDFSAIPSDRCHSEHAYGDGYIRCELPAGHVNNHEARPEKGPPVNWCPIPDCESKPLTVAQFIRFGAWNDSNRLFTVRDPDSGKEIVACKDTFLLPENLAKYGAYQVVRTSITRDEVANMVEQSAIPFQ